MKTKGDPYEIFTDVLDTITFYTGWQKRKMWKILVNCKNVKVKPQIKLIFICIPPEVNKRDG